MSNTITDNLKELISKESSLTEDTSLKSFEEASKEYEELKLRGLTSKRQFNIMSLQESLKMAPFINQAADVKKTSVMFQINASFK